MRKLLVIILLTFGLLGCSWLDLVEPTLKVVDGIEELSQPRGETEEKQAEKCPCPCPS